MLGGKAEQLAKHRDRIPGLGPRYQDLMMNLVMSTQDVSALDGFWPWVSLPESWLPRRAGHMPTLVRECSAEHLG